jgi:hypothetical protein
MSDIRNLSAVYKEPFFVFIFPRTIFPSEILPRLIDEEMVRGKSTKIFIFVFLPSRWKE